MTFLPESNCGPGKRRDRGLCRLDHPDLLDFSYHSTKLLKAEYFYRPTVQNTAWLPRQLS